MKDDYSTIQLQAVNDQNSAAAKDWVRNEVFGNRMRFAEMLGDVAEDYKKLRTMPEYFQSSLIGLGVAKVYELLVEICHDKGVE